MSVLFYSSELVFYIDTLRTMDHPHSIFILGIMIQFPSAETVALKIQ